MCTRNPPPQNQVLSGNIEVEIFVSSFAFNIQTLKPLKKQNKTLTIGVLEVTQDLAAQNGVFLGQGGQLLEELREEGRCQHGVPHRQGQARGHPRHLGSVRQEGLKHSRGTIQKVLANSCPGGVLNGI